MKTLSSLLVIFSFLLTFCSRNKISDKDYPEIIDIKTAFEKKEAINVEELSSEQEYIVLETTDESLIGSNYVIYCDDQNIIVVERKRFLLFDRSNGKFIRVIGKSGNGPDEFSNTYTKVPFNEDKKTVYAARNRVRFEYDLTGKLLNTFKGPDLVSEFVNIDESTYASYINNYMGDEKNKVVVFTQSDSILKIFPNYLSFAFKGSINVYLANSWFFRLDKKLYFCEKFNDTVFHLTPNSLEPRFVFDKGAYTFPYELRGDMLNTEAKYFVTENILVSSRYIFFVFRYNSEVFTSVYDMKQKKLHVNNYSHESGKGFIGNKDEFAPPEISSINGKGELICTIDPLRLKLWFEAHPEKFEKLPENIKKLRGLPETDNPVVLIARLRN